MSEYSSVHTSADQLIAAVKRSTDPTPAVLTRYGYAYDPAGNRLTERNDDVVVGATYDSMNRLVSQGAAGLLEVEGTVDEPAFLPLNGKPVPVGAEPPAIVRAAGEETPAQGRRYQSQSRAPSR